jgi:hypothetical protein
VLGGEEICDLELDRSTKFRERVPESSGDHDVPVTEKDKEIMGPPPPQRQRSMEIVDTTSSLMDSNIKEEPEVKRDIAQMPLKIVGPRFQPAPMTSNSPFFQPTPFVSVPDLEVRMRFYNAILSQLERFPLIKRDESVKPYMVAESKAVWDSWNIGRRQACEWARAQHLHNRCCAGDVFFTVRRVLRFCRVIKAVPFLPRGEITLDQVDSALIKAKVAERKPDNVVRSDVEYVWQVVGQLKPGAVPELDWEEGSDWVTGGLKLYAGVRGFVDRVLSVGRANGVGLKDGAGELAKAIKAHGQELSFLDCEGLDGDIRNAMEK